MMLYRPDIRTLVRLSTEVFTHKRWMSLPHQIYLGWMQTSGGLREPTPIPLALRFELKDGYHWPELIH